MRLEALDIFITLVELDAQVARFLREQKTIAHEKVLFSTQIAQIDAQLSAQELIIKKLKTHTHSLDTDLQTVDSQLSQKKSRIAIAANPKEFFALENEIQALDKHKNHIEEQLFSLWQELETKQAEHQDFSSQMLPQKEKLQKQLTVFEKSLEHATTRIAQLRQDRPALLSVVPKELIDQYTTMLESIDNPVVPILKDTCSGCFYSATAQMLQNAEKNELVKCIECHRLLYALRDVRNK